MDIQKKIALCLLPLAFSANAADNSSFATIKLGLNVPTFSKNDAGVKSAGNAMTGGLEFGHFVSDNALLSFEYNSIGKTKFSFNDALKGGVSNPYTEKYKWSVKRSDVFLVNAGYNFAKFDNITPYLKAGVGVAKNKIDKFTMSIDSKNGAGTALPTIEAFSPAKSKTNFAWKVGFGLNLECDDSIDIDLAYSLTSRGKITLAASTTIAQNGAKYPISQKTVSLLDHAIVAGLKIKF